MSHSHSLFHGSTVLLALGAASALLGLGCATSPGTAVGPETAGTVVPDEPARAVAATRCVTIERGVNGDVKDAWIASGHPGQNYGDLITTSAGNVAGKARLSLFKFDLSGIPAGARVVKASLTLHGATMSEAPFTVHRAAVAWDERDVTWESFDNAYEETAETTVWTRADPAAQTVAFITPLVRDWVSGKSDNNGIVLRPESEGGALSLGTFYASETESAADRPHLEVCFIPAADPANSL